MTTKNFEKPSPDEVRESHEQFAEAWSLYARNSEHGEVFDMNNLLIANARLPWYLSNAAILTAPMSSSEELAICAEAAIKYFAKEKNPWFFIGGRQWLGEGASATLSRLGLTELFTVTGMVSEQLTTPERPVTDVNTRRIEDEASRLALADLNAAAYDVSKDWVRLAASGESLWNTPLYGYNAYVDGQPAATAFAMPLNGVIYVAYAATALAHRRKGLAELVMRRSIEHAMRDTGITRTVLHATADGCSMYMKMGYRPVEEFAIYTTQF